MVCAAQGVHCHCEARHQPKLCATLKQSIRLRTGMGLGCLECNKAAVRMCVHVSPQQQHAAVIPRQPLHLGYNRIHDSLLCVRSTAQSTHLIQSQYALQSGVAVQNSCRTCQHPQSA